MTLPAGDSPIRALADGAAAPSRAAQRRGLAAVFGSTFCELTGFFMFAPLLIFTLKAQGLATAQVGLFSALLWVGIFAATPFSARWVRALGARRALIASVALPLVTLTGIVLVESVWLWALLYFLAGVGAALRWIVAEATVAELAPAHRRGRVVGLFEAMVGATFVLGPALLAWIGTEGTAAEHARWTALALVALGFAITFLVPRGYAARQDHGTRLGWHGIADAVRAAPTVMLAGFTGGFFESGLAGLLPLYGLVIGLSAALAALLVSASGLGATLMMLPVGELSDRLPRRSVFIACAAATLVGTLLLPAVPHLGALAWLIAFVWGGAGGAMYTLAMIEIGHRHQGTALVNATAVLVLAYALGSMLAPAAGAFALQFAPQWGFPGLLAAVASLALVVLLRGR
jgi:MFS family permease